jgi:hypothetical protein
MKRFTLSFVVACALISFVSGSQAAIVNVNSLTNHESNPVVLSLPPGEYTVTPVGTVDGGAYNSWNPWSSVSGCDVDGANCSTGWVNWYFVASVEFPEQSLWDENRYANSSLALTNAIGTSFTLTSDADVSFYIKDGVNGSFTSDNAGGMSLSVVPIPGAIWLLGSGLLGLIGIARRNNAA